MNHEHDWTRLYFVLGPYAVPQPSHGHQCFDRRCLHMLVAPGKDCEPSVKHEIRKP